VTLTAAAGLLVAFAAADLLLFSALRITLNRSVDDSARQAATQVVALINSQPLPDPVPVAAGTVTIQVLSPAGRIVDASPGADRLVPLLSPAQAAASARTGDPAPVHGAPYGLPGLLRVVAEPAADGSVVIAAVPYSSASASLSVVGRALMFGTPLLFVLFTWAIWLAIGSTLRPITLLRRGAAAVSVTGVPRALPVPSARDEVRSLALTLNGMLSRLALAQQRQRDLVSDTAHELRSPIAAIRTQLEVALDHPSLQDWESTARDVHADTLRLARLAEDLLVLARLDERATTVGPGTTAGTDTGAGPDAGAARPAGPGKPAEATDLTTLIESVTARYSNAPVPVVATTDTGTGTATGTPLETDISSYMVIGDAAGLDRLLVNLIDNAVRYAKSRVTVTARRNGEWAELAVTDDGPGISAADRERAFGRFTRLDDSRSRDDESGGAGLGLAIVRATAQAYGGTACLEAARADGAASGLRAVVRLPLMWQEVPMGHAALLPAAPRDDGGDRDSREQKGQVGDREVEQAHRDWTLRRSGRDRDATGHGTGG
jgi:signal transduction histidine kinase